VVLAIAALAGRAELPQWVRFVESGSKLENAFFRPMNLPAGPVTVRRPAKEARAELSNLISATPSDAQLYALRAHEEELLLDFPAAEADWKKHVELAQDKAAANLALANYYHRQLKVNEEWGALSAAGAYPRMLALCQRQMLPAAMTRQTYEQWTAKAPKEQGPMQSWVRFEISEKEFSRVDTLLGEYARRFPNDSDFPIEARASVESAKGNSAAALAVYDRAFQPLWPQRLVHSYFTLLTETRNLRRFLLAARASAAANPLALDPVARQFRYYLEEGNPAAAQRVLHDYRRRKEAKPGSWSGDELLTMARLWNQYGNDRTEAARCFYALYSLKGATPAQQEEALASIASIMFSAADQRLPLGGGDLSFYKDIASADPYPGFLNGILSLLLNSADPAYRFAGQERQSTPYFQRAKASELVDLFERRFPQSDRRAGLRAQLLEAYAVHGDNDAVLTSGRRFLTDFPDHSARVQVSLLMADAHARKNQTSEELAVYDALLAELGRKAEGVPLGEGVMPGAARPGPKSLEYARVLDRYVSRLVALKRVRDALAVLRKEIDRNPNDPGLYERLAGFLDQNKLAAEMETVYRRAIERFPDRSWYHKLARFYLRQKQRAAFQQLTADVARVFSGTELEKYFADVVATAGLDNVLYRQVNQYAYQRFPNDLTFVRNLLDVYQRRGTADPVAYERLLRRYWYYDDQMRGRFFSHLAGTGKLRTEMASLRSLAAQAGNPGAVRMLAEADVWRCHFEDASGRLLSLAREAPGEADTGQRAASLYRSLAAYDWHKAEEASAIEQALVRAAPRNMEVRVRLGEINREYPRATAGRNAWAAIPEIEPGASDGILEAATVHWDYFEYDAALSVMEAGRKRLNKPALFAYEAGAIYENKRQYNRAIEEYVRGAMAEPGGSLAQTRLIQLARRPAYRGLIDEATARLAGGASPTIPALALRVALLEAQERGPDLEAYLLNLAAQTQRFDLLTRVEEEGRRLVLPKVEERALLREIDLTSDPIDKLRLRLNLARYYESHFNPTAAGRLFDTLYRENATTLGVVRAVVNYHWRNKNAVRAVEVLAAAASSANAVLKPQLQFEAARKATEAGFASQARTFLQPLLAAEPYNAAYLGAMADTYAREGDDGGLRAFYGEKIALLAKAQLPAQERLERVAAMRRALIPVLTRAKDTAGAADQYIEIINRFPEDTALLEEAAAYARTHQQQARLLAVYQKAAAASPRDFRWPLVLARLDTSFEDYPVAIEMYTRAAEIRPDRSDLLAARGNLEERLLRFDEAAATFAKVYDLTYRNSAWMERVAEIRARQGRTGDCLKALETAFLEGRADSPQAQFDVAERLERWEMIPQARQYAERGVSLAGTNLLTLYAAGAQVYARVLTRLGQYAAVSAKDPDGQLLPAMAQAVREHFDAARKGQFAAFLDGVKNASPEIGRIAGLPEWEAKRRFALMMAKPGEEAQENFERLRQLQRSRLAFGELGAQLEAYAGKLADDPKTSMLNFAAEAYRKAGDEGGEFRVLAARGILDDRYLSLMARRAPDQLIALSGAGSRDAAANAAIRSGKADLTMAAIASRGRGLAPVWTRAYTGLAGLYFGLQTADIDTAFQQALGSLLIGDRVGKPVDRREQLAGSVWYYYGSRYGEYLHLGGKPQFDDYMPSMVEGSPGNAQSYFQLAEFYRQSGLAPRALADYEYSLQLDPRRISALDRMARVLWSQNRRDEAKVRWKQALTATGDLLEERRIPAWLSSDLRELIDELAGRQLLAELRPDLERIVISYVKRYGSFQTEPLLKHFDVSSIVAISRSAPSPLDLLGPLIDADWIPEAQKGLLYERILEATRTRLATAVGDARNMALNDFYNWKARWYQFLMDRKQTGRLGAELAALDDEAKQRLSYMLPQLELRIAADTGKLTEETMQPYASNPYLLRDVAVTLKEEGDAAHARQLLRFFYQSQIGRGDTAASNFLGLAEVLLENGETDAAVRELRRMSLITQPAFVNLKDAGELLRRFGKNSEGMVFLEEAVKAVPWDTAAKAALDAARSPASAAPERTLAQLQDEVRGQPTNESLKLALFRAALTAGRHREAANALEVLLGPGMSMLFNEDHGRPDDIEVNRYWVEGFLPGQNLSKAERASIARGLADCLARTDRVEGALLTRLVAEKLAPDPQDAAHISAWRAELTRRTVNAERRPEISENLDQPRLVRPMLPATGGAR
jgi:tetratricopeptide (TPR) repeat protein